MPRLSWHGLARVVDGAVAAAYIHCAKQLLEAPATLFID